MTSRGGWDCCLVVECWVHRLGEREEKERGKKEKKKKKKKKKPTGGG